MLVCKCVLRVCVITYWQITIILKNKNTNIDFKHMQSNGAIPVFLLIKLNFQFLGQIFKAATFSRIRIFKK